LDYRHPAGARVLIDAGKLVTDTGKVGDYRYYLRVLEWWRKRKHLLSAANESPAPTERWTLHIEKPFIEKIKAEAEAEHVTVTEVINRIIRHYYAGK
jgi:hypothetical protein